MQFSKCRLKLDVVSAFNLFPDDKHVHFVNDCCRLLSGTLPVSRSLSLSLKRTLVGGRRFRPDVAAVSGRRFRLNFGHLEFMYFG